MADNLIFQNTAKITSFSAENMGSRSNPPKMLIYKPGKKNGFDLTGYISDFFITAYLSRHNELLLPIPSIEDTDEKKANDEYNFAKNHDCAMLEIFAGEPDTDEKILIDRIAVWNRLPVYRASILERFTPQKNLVIPPGHSLWGTVAHPSDEISYDPTDPTSAAPAYTILRDGEMINVSIRAYEEGSIQLADIGTLNWKIINLNLQNPGTEYSFRIPDGAMGYSFKCRGDSSANDAIADVRFSWETGKVTGGDGYDILLANNEDSQAYTPPMFGKTIYFSSAVPGVVLSIKTLVS